METQAIIIINTVIVTVVLIMSTIEIIDIIKIKKEIKEIETKLKLKKDGNNMEELCDKKILENINEEIQEKIFPIMKKFNITNTECTIHFGNGEQHIFEFEIVKIGIEEWVRKHN